MPTTNRPYVTVHTGETVMWDGTQWVSPWVESQWRQAPKPVKPKRGPHFIGQRVKLLKPKYLQGKLATITYIGNYYSHVHGYHKAAQLDIDGLGRWRKNTGTAFSYPFSYLKIISGFGSFGAWAKAKKEEGLNV